MAQRIKIRYREKTNSNPAAQTSSIPNRLMLIRKVLVAAITGKIAEEHVDSAINIMAEALVIAEDEIRGLAVIALFELGGSPAKLVPILRRAAMDPNETVRRRAVRVLAEYGEESLLALDTLIHALGDNDPVVRMEAVNSLGKVGPAAEPAIPLLIEMLQSMECRIWITVRACLRKIGPACVNYLSPLLKHFNPLVRERVINFIGQMRYLDEEVVQQLLECCRDSDEEVRKAAYRAIEQLERAAGGIPVV